MKKIRDASRYRRYQAERAKSSLRRNRYFNNYRKAKRRAQQGIPRTLRRHVSPHEVPAPRGYRTVVAPTVLSMVSNPEESITFVAKLANHYARRNQVFVSLKKVTKVDYDAIVVLLSVMIRFKAAKIGFNGDLPKNAGAKSIIMKSKFLESLYEDFAEQDVYKIGNQQSIYTHANKNVDSKLSAQIIEQAAETVWGEVRRCQGVQRIFLELMQNTNNHASLDQQGEKHWWLSVNHRTKEKKVSFSFVDFGVGVFHSLDNKNPGSKWFAWRTKLFSLFTPTNNAEILQLMLQGQLHRTVTGKYYRGKGLPGIKEVFKRNGVSRLLIITNDVYADVSQDMYRLLRVPFGGTLVYWELEASNTSSELHGQDQEDQAVGGAAV